MVWGSQQRRDRCYTTTESESDRRPSDVKRLVLLGCKKNWVRVTSRQSFKTDSALQVSTKYVELQDDFEKMRISNRELIRIRWNFWSTNLNFRPPSNHQIVYCLQYLNRRINSSVLFHSNGNVYFPSRVLDENCTVKYSTLLGLYLLEIVCMFT